MKIELIKKKGLNRLEITFYHDPKKDNRRIQIKGFGKWENFKINAI